MSWRSGQVLKIGSRTTNHEPTIDHRSLTTDDNDEGC